MSLSVAGPHASAEWHFPKPYGWKTVFAIMIAFAILIFTGHRVEMDRAAMLTGQALRVAAGAGGDSQVAKGFGAVAGKLFPLQLDERTDTDRIPAFDPRHLPPLAHVEAEQVRTQTLNPETLKLD